MSRRITYLVAAITLLTSCDCIQQATGVVLDRQTKAPVENVALGKYEKPDTNNSYSRRIYTDSKGQFDYRSTSGGFIKCPDLILYFDKQGYKIKKMTFKSFTQNDTVFLDKIPF